MLPVGLPHGRDQVLVQFVKPKKKIMFKAVIMTNIMVMMIDDGDGEGRWSDQPIVRRLNHQLATPNLGKHHHIHLEHN